MREARLARPVLDIPRKLELADFLVSVACESCPCLEPDDTCDACVASAAVVALNRLPVAKRAKAAIAIVRGEWVEDNCYCNWPSPGESGVILSRECRAREVIGEKPALEHTKNAERSGVVPAADVVEAPRPRGRPREKRFGSTLERRIQQQGHSVRAFAELVGSTPSSMSRMVRGLQGAPPAVLDAMCSRLSCSPAELYEPEDAAAPAPELDVDDPG